MSSLEPHTNSVAHRLTVAAFSAAAFMLTACSPVEPNGAGHDDRAFHELMLLRDAPAGQVTENGEKCEAIGGTWRQDGMLGAYNCFEVYSDGGKSCNDSMQCEGECRANSIDAKSGACQIDSGPFGCHGQMIDGVAMNFICVD